MFHIVLVEPEIPQNTGNIARTCAATGCMLHLIEPLGFSIGQKEVKRAGLDYWDKVLVDTYPSLEDLFLIYPNVPAVYATTKATKRYDKVTYTPGTFLVFGKETKGLPAALLEREKEHLVRVPMKDGLRSLNLSNSVAVMIYEGLRQNDFLNLI